MFSESLALQQADSFSGLNCPEQLLLMDKKIRAITIKTK